MKKFWILCSLLAGVHLSAQLQIDFNEQQIQKDFVTNFNLYGSAYIDPILDVYSYNQLSGWVTSAKVLEPWKVRIQVVGALSMVPDDKLHFNFNDLAFTDSLSSVALKDPSDPILPTVLGGSTDKVFIYTIQDENGTRYSEEIPVFEGIASPFNAVPDVVPQLNLGLPGGTEVNLRFFPPFDITGVDHQHWGLGVRHQVSQYLDKENFYWSVGGNFSRNAYSYEPGEFLEGENQEIRLRSDAWQLQTSMGWDWKILHLFGNLSYYSWDNSFEILGSYRYNVEQTGPLGVLEVKEAFSVTNPVKINREAAGVRVSAGASISILKFLEFTAVYGFNPRHSLVASLNFKI